MGWMSPQQQQFGNRCGNFGMQVGSCETPGEPKIEESHLEKWLHTHVAGSPVMVLVTDLETVLFPCRLNYSFSCPWSCQCHMLAHDLAPAPLSHGLGSVLPTQDPTGDTLLLCVPRGGPADLGPGYGSWRSFVTWFKKSQLWSGTQSCPSKDLPSDASRALPGS